MQIKIPDFSLVLLMGASASGKSTLARRFFLPTEIISSDECRARVGDDETDQSMTPDAFSLLHTLAGLRLKNRRLTVIDATNVEAAARKSLLALAREYHALPVIFVLDMPERVCRDHNLQRAKQVPYHAINRQIRNLRSSLRNLKAEGFRYIYTFRSPEELDQVQEIVREKLYNDLRHETGPFDIIGDVHGCREELSQLLHMLGYEIQTGEEHRQGYRITPPPGRRAVFVGDLVDRGPDSPGVLRMVMSMVQTGAAFCVPGNHDVKLAKYLEGRQVKLTHGLDLTVQQLQHASREWKEEVLQFLKGLVSHYVLDAGRLVVAHAGIKENMQGRGSGEVRDFCLYGETTGETDEFGLPVRLNWAASYRGKALVVYGHTPVPEAEMVNNTIDIDTGCVFGGKLTAYRYPEGNCVQVPAQQQYCVPVRPLLPAAPARSAQQEADDMLHIQDVTGKQVFSNRICRHIPVEAYMRAAALELMSRYGMDPHWLIYLPPTMSPSATSTEPGYLEHPAQALEYYRKQGVQQVVWEEKHMGSRAVVVVCQDAATARSRFGVTDGSIGACYTRTGRNFFTDAALGRAFLERVQACLSRAGFWETFGTGWVCLDAELMPWSAKAQALLQTQYAAVGAAGTASLSVARQALAAAARRGITAAASLEQDWAHKENLHQEYIQAYRQYCWPVHTLADYKLAPFHLMATEGAVHTDKPHTWHMETLARLCDADSGLMQRTRYRVVDLQDAGQCAAAVSDWMQLTAAGGEGMVFKPLDFLAWNKQEIVQPAVKCRGRAYLRLIYGPEYDLPQHLNRLRERGLRRKQNQAVQGLALGVESLERFVNREPLRRVHEAAMAVLALETNSTDPRL